MVEYNLTWYNTEFFLCIIYPQKKKSYNTYSKNKALQPKKKENVITHYIHLEYILINTSKICDFVST